MPTQIVLASPIEDIALCAKRKELAAVRAVLAEREVEVANLRIELRMFELRYLREVGVLYAELDDIEARIAEREVALYDSDAARKRATEARRRANETHDAAFGVDQEPALEPSVSLKELFRDVARRAHPDFARNAEEQAHCTRLMARANQAYRRGDAEMLQRILDDFHEVNADSGEDTASELYRITRQLAHAARDIQRLEEELAHLPAGEISQLKAEFDAACVEGRDLLADLAATLRQRIADAKYRFDFSDRQIKAHGR